MWYITPKRCGWQGYGIFMFLWQFFIPMVIFVVTYWKILAVIRRQAKIAAQLHQSSIAPEEPVAGTSAGTTKPTDVGPNKKAGSRQVRGQTVSKSLSQAQINVVRTMVYITVCFTLCWMPMYCIVLFKRGLVSSLSYVICRKSLFHRKSRI